MRADLNILYMHWLTVNVDILQSASRNSFVFCVMFRCAEHLSGATCDEGRPLDDVRRDLPWAQGLLCISAFSALSAHSFVLNPSDS